MSEPTRVIPRRAVVSWITYDLANVIFSMGVTSLNFSLFVRSIVGSERADSLVGRISAVSMGIMFCISPLLGAMTDRARRRMPFLMWATVICCAMTALIGRGPFALSMLAFVIANGGYQAGVQFYDSLLPEVTTEENRGRINGIAIGLGYLGSYIAVGVSFLMTSKTHEFPFANYFLFIGVAFLALATPCFLFVRERGNPHPRPIFTFDAVAESTRQTVQTLKSGHRYPGTSPLPRRPRVLHRRDQHRDSVHVALHGERRHLDGPHEGGRRGEGASSCSWSAITAAIVGGITWGFIVDRIGPKRTLNIVLSGWMLTFVGAACVGFLHLTIVWLFVVACAAGICLGGTWASDRPLMLRLTPPDRVGEFYGLYGMVGRFSAVVGPLIWAATTWLIVEKSGMPVLTGEAFAILSLLVMVIVAFAILRRVTDTPRDWKTLGSDAAAAGATLQPAGATSGPLLE